MEANYATQVQIACDDLYCDPLNESAKARLKDLLLGGAHPLMTAENYRRRLRIACDELHDDPSDADAQYALLLLTMTPVSEIVTSIQPAMV